MEKLQIGIIADYNNKRMVKLIIDEINKKGYDINNIIFMKTYKNKIMKIISKIPLIKFDEILVKLKNKKKANYEKELLKIRNEYENNGIKINDILFENNLKLKENCKIKYITAENINNENVHKYMKKSGIKNYIYVSSSLIKKPTFNIGINLLLVHPGKLPQFRGRDCMIWSQLYEEKYTWSAIYVNEGVDTGDIIAQTSENVQLIKIENTKENRDKLFNFIQHFYNFQKKAELIAVMCEKLHKNEYKYIGKKQEYSKDSRQFYKANEEIIDYAMKKMIKD